MVTKAFAEMRKAAEFHLFVLKLLFFRNEKKVMADESLHWSRIVFAFVRISLSGALPVAGEWSVAATEGQEKSNIPTGGEEKVGSCYMNENKCLWAKVAIAEKTLPKEKPGNGKEE